MKTKYIPVLILVSAAVGAAVTKSYFPTVKTETVTQEVIKEKTVTEIRQETRPDGTVVTETVVVEDRDQTKDVKESKVDASKLPDWMLSVGQSVSASPVYTMSIQRRILGPVWLGAAANTSKELFVTVGVEF
jgi:hypothetical protein